MPATTPAAAFDAVMERVETARLREARVRERRAYQAGYRDAWAGRYRPGRRRYTERAAYVDGYHRGFDDVHG